MLVAGTHVVLVLNLLRATVQGQALQAGSSGRGAGYRWHGGNARERMDGAPAHDRRLRSHHDPGLQAPARGLSAQHVAAWGFLGGAWALGIQGALT